MADFNAGAVKGKISIDFGSVRKAEQAVKSLHKSFSTQEAAVKKVEKSYSKASKTNNQMAASTRKAEAAEKARINALSQADTKLRGLNQVTKEYSVRTKSQEIAVKNANKAIGVYRTTVERSGAGSVKAAKAKAMMTKRVNAAKTAVSRHGKEVKNLQSATQDLTKSVQLALGPLSGVASRITAMTALFNRNTLAVAGAVGAFTGLSVAMFQSIRAGAQLEQQMFKVGTVLEATGNTTRFTKEEINDLAIELGEATMTSANMARRASSILMTFGIVSKDSFEEAMYAAQGLSAVMGGNLESNVRRIGRLLEAPSRNLSALSRAGLQFTAQQEDLIKSLERTGDLAGAQAVVMKRLEVFTKAATGETQGLNGAIDTAGERFRRLFENASLNAGAVESLTEVVNTFSAEIKALSENEQVVQALGKAFTTLAKIGANAVTTLVEQIDKLAAVLVGAGVATAVGALNRSFIAVSGTSKVAAGSISIFSKAVTVLTVAVNRLKVAIMTNPIGALLAVGAAAATWAYFNREVEEANSKLSETRAQVEGVSAALRNMGREGDALELDVTVSMRDTVEQELEDAKKRLKAFQKENLDDRRSGILNTEAKEEAAQLIARIKELEEALGNLNNKAESMKSQADVFRQLGENFSSAASEMEGLTDQYVFNDDKLLKLNNDLKQAKKTLENYDAQVAGNAEMQKYLADNLHLTREKIVAVIQAIRQQKSELTNPLEDYVAELREQYQVLGMNVEQLVRYKAAKIAAENPDITNPQQYIDEAVAIHRSTEERRKLADRMEALAETTASSEKTYAEWVASIYDSIDPLAAAERQVQKIWKAWDNGEGALGNLNKDQVKDYTDALLDAANTFENKFMESADSVASALQQSIASGDWGSLGDAIGNTLATSVAGALDTAITDVLSRDLTAGSGMFAQMGAAFAGPIAGAVAGAGIQLAMQEITDWFSGSDWDPTESRQAAQGAGTVLGSIDAKSESIANSLELVSNTNDKIVNINTNMLKTLQRVQSGIVGATAMVVRQNSGVKAPALSLSKDFDELTGPLDPIIGKTTDMAVDFFDSAIETFTFGLVDGFVGDALGSVMGGSQKVVDSGIRILGGHISDLINETIVQSYATIKEDGGWFGSDKRFDKFKELDTNQFTLVFENIYDSVMQGAGVLGVLPDDIQKRMDKFVVETQRISLEGLSADEQRTEIEAVFGTIFDGLAGSVVPFLDEIQRAGEGMGETLARAASQVQVMKEAMLTLGLTTVDVTARIRTLAADGLAELFGGVEAFANALVGFEKNFLDEARQFEVNSRRLGEALGDLPLPETREGFAALVAVQNQYTAEGRQNIATLLKLQETANEYYDTLEERQKEALDTGLSDLKKAIDARKEELKKQYDLEVEQINKTADARLEANQLALDAAKAGLSAIEEEIKGINQAAEALRGGYAPIQQNRRANAMDKLVRALRSGDLTGAGEASELAAEINKDSYTNSREYKTEQARTLFLLGSLQEEGKNQLTAAERAVESLEKAREAINVQTERLLEQAQIAYENEITRLDSIYENAVEQVNVLRGIDTSVMSVREAVENMQIKIEAAKATAKARERATSSASPMSESDIAKKYEEVLGLSGNFAGRDERIGYWADQNLSAGQFDQKFIDKAKNLSSENAAEWGTSVEEREALLKVKGYATGGVHGGGLRIVGENGPELEATGPSRIYSNNQTQSLLSNTEMLQELKSLRQEISEMKASTVATAKNTNKTSKQLNRWDVEGLPEERQFLQQSEKYVVV